MHKPPSCTMTANSSTAKKQTTGDKSKSVHLRNTNSPYWAVSSRRLLVVILPATSDGWDNP